MTKNIQEPGTTLSVRLAARIVASYVARNHVSTGELTDMISNVGGVLERLRNGSPADVRKPVPVVDIRGSVTKDYIICLEDGLKFKSLKRHLSKLALTPEEYRRKWDLPDDYPMMAPNSASKRSALAKQFGLGKKRAQGNGARE
ncbi:MULTISPECIES: MucR family transcriptional regulator [unclassified Ensifer]|uniref:MucR family transcriptional regulator n=1 Tax=unclassified Ensifer TaxID=2633371 RepID=UPI0030105522